jgi:antitoxin component of MazEF toxin-antitoxin module
MDDPQMFEAMLRETGSSKAVTVPEYLVKKFGLEAGKQYRFILLVER